MIRCRLCGGMAVLFGTLGFGSTVLALQSGSAFGSTMAFALGMAFVLASQYLWRFAREGH